MNLPEMPYKSANKKSYQTKFGGYNHTLGASDGEIYDMQNMASDNYPVLSPRHQRYLLRSLTKPHGIFNHGNKMVWVDGTSFYYDGTACGTVADSDKQFAAINNRIIIFPDKKYFNTDTLKSKGTYATIAALESTVLTPTINDIYLVGSTAPYKLYYWNGDEWVQNKYTFGDLESTFTGAVSFLGEGELFDTSAEANTIYSNGIEWSDYFEEGDAVTITGCTEHAENNKTPIIREIDGSLLRFYENTFTCDEKSSYTSKGLLKAGEENAVYIFSGMSPLSATMTSGQSYYFGTLEVGVSYSFTYLGTIYYFTNTYNHVAYFRYVYGTGVYIYYGPYPPALVSVSTTPIADAISLNVQKSNGTESIPYSVYIDGKWYTFNLGADTTDETITFLTKNETIRIDFDTPTYPTLTSGKTGAILNNLAYGMIYVYDAGAGSAANIAQINYYFHTKTDRIVFRLTQSLIEDEKIIWNNSTMMQDNLGTISDIDIYTKIDISYMGSGVYKSEKDTWLAGNYYFVAGDDTIYFTIASGGTPITHSGYFGYNGTILTYYYGTSSTETISTYDVSVDTELTFAEVPIDYTESSVTLKRALPDMDYLCSDHNRLWGCKDDTIYASKLGDPFNFNVFDDLSTDSWSVNIGTAGKLTGCLSYLGYPTFFKEDMIYKIYGSTPKNYEGAATMSLGLANHESMAVAGETLFYLNKEGICAYTGGVPRLISAPLGVKYNDGVAGSDGMKYYISMKDTSGAYSLFVYDTLSMLWHREDNLQALSFCYTDQLNVLTSDGKIKTVSTCSKPTGSTEEGNVPWMVQFADFYADSPNKKGVSKVHLRLNLETGATATAYIKYNGDASWTMIKEMQGAYKQSYYLPIRPRRGDSFSIKLEGAGKCDIYSLSLEYYTGSQL